MKLYNNFASATMNKDLEVRLMPKSIFLDAKNIRIISPDSQNSRSVKFALGNTAVTSLSLGSGAVCTGYCVDGLSNKIYWVVGSNTGSYVCEYDTDNDTEAIVLGDERGLSTRIFNFPTTGNVEMRVYNDNDNGRNFLFITDGIGEPYYFEIEAAKALTNSAFTLQNVSIIKAPPFTAPTLTLGETVSNKENNMEVKFLSFAYRYEYKFGEYSALSPFSEFAFYPSAFKYDYNTGTNKSMFNVFSKVDIEFNTGGEDVIGIDIIVKESKSNTPYIVESFDKDNEGWADDSVQSLEFSNSKIYRGLDSGQLSRVFDNVPTSAKTLELIGNRVVFGNYTEGYDLIGRDGNTIFPSFTLDYISDFGAEGTAHKQVKSNRDYEIAIAYLDGKGRMTTPLTSEGNTTFVLNEHADYKNSLQVTINSKAPDWAVGYRFFIKQSKNSYDTIVPLTFYRDGVMAWIKIEGSDKNKISEGDFLYVKSDTNGLKNSTIRTKVLEISTQERNFLETDPAIIDGDEELQRAGTYFRVEVNDFALSPSAVTNFTGTTDYAFRSANTANNFGNQVSYIEDIYYNGSTLNDLTDNNTYTGSEDVRFEIEINGTSSPNTFRWRTHDVSNNVVSSYSATTNITAGAQSLSNGLTITFGSTTGHTLNDKWVISCKAGGRLSDWNQGGLVGTDGRSAIMLFEGKPSNNETIRAGASITLTYDDSSSGDRVTNRTGYVTENLTASTDYPNLEEWFYGDNVISQMTYPSDPTHVIFRRGTLSNDGQSLTIDPTGRMYMAVLSEAQYEGSAGSEIRIDTSINITELNNSIIFETIPVDEDSEIFYELPYTYLTSNDHHLGRDGGLGTDNNQTFPTIPAVITLDFFNSFGWYNGFESIKIGDTFNEKEMALDVKPLSPIDNYKQITRIASLTYSDVYEGTTQYNGLNAFNLSTTNYKDLDTKYGSIQKLHSKDTDLTVFQEDKTHRVLYSKSVLYAADGAGNIRESNEVLGSVVAYTGEHGIGKRPESFAFYGTRIYHIDDKRGALMRLSTDGYTDISKKGFSDYFRTLGNQENYVGGYDPYNDEYLINVAPDGDPLTIAFIEGAEGGFTAFYEYEPERLVGVNNRLYSMKNGQLYLHDSNETRMNFYGDQRLASITTLFNDSPNDIKHWKSINTESTNPWSIELTTPHHIGYIDPLEFSLEEGEYYAYIRQNEGTDNESLTEGISNLQGIGEINDLLGGLVSVPMLPRSTSIGDAIYKSSTDGSTITQIGFISGIGNNNISVSPVTGLAVGDFILLGKDSRTEGESIKGYYLKVKMTNDATTDEELFAVKVEAVRSFD